MKIEQWKINRVLPYARNARTHSPEQVDQLSASLKEFGFVNPCLVDADGVLVAGHGRILGAKKLGLKKVPVIVLGHLTSAQVKALRLADNRIALNAGWNEQLLRLELGELRALDFNLDLTGFAPLELLSYTIGDTKAGADPEAVPELRPAVSVLGDIWHLGPHRLYAGDSTKPEAVAALLGGAKPHLMVTDPPYGVEYDPRWRMDRGVNKNLAKMGSVLNDSRANWSEAYALFPGDVAYAWSADLRSRHAVQALEDAGFIVVAQIIWAKDRFALGRGDYHFQHEPCWYAVKKGANHRWCGGRDKTTLWSIPARDDSGHGHGTQKPIECMRRPIINNSRPGQSVYDPFGGSGTTLIAAEMTGRVCYMMELDPVYVDVVVRRWQNLTGKQAALGGDPKRTLDAVAKERGVIDAQGSGRESIRRRPAAAVPESKVRAKVRNGRAASRGRAHRVTPLADPAGHSAG